MRRSPAPGRRPAGPSAPTFGIEEEYLLLDPVTGLPVPRADRVLHLAGRRSDGDDVIDADLQPELVRAQLEIATPVCRHLDEARESITVARAGLARAARQVGTVLAPVGAAPMDDGGLVPVTDADRYQAIHAGAPGLVDEHLVNGMHVHVGVPDRGAGVAVMNRLRPWLHVLLALSANSPVWRGRDTGFASWRAVQGQRWGVEGVPPAFLDAPDYYRRVDVLVATGVVLDRRQLYWSVRLAERHPTVEVRVADVQLDVEAAVMIAALVRALTMVALDQARDDGPVPDLPVELVRAAGWQAARDGTSGDLVDLTDLDGGPGGMPRIRPAADVVGRLLDHVAPAADPAGLEEVLPTVAATLIGAGGAQRQRRALARGGLPELLDLLRVHTLNGARGPAPASVTDGNRRGRRGPVLSGT